VVGKSQASGGQETGPSSNDGELSNVWTLPIWGDFDATFFTTPDGGDLNIYNSTSCAGRDCIYKTELNVFNIAWNGNNTPIGSAAGCTHENCTPEQREGIFVNDYQIDSFEGVAVTGDCWSMKYTSVARGDLDGSPVQLIMNGQITMSPTCPRVDGTWRPESSPILYIFGENLIGVTGLWINDVKVDNWQEYDGTILSALLPPGVTGPPWKVKVITRAGCGYIYPRPCGRTCGN
jgi:hypothetical protein